MVIFQTSLFRSFFWIIAGLFLFTEMEILASDSTVPIVREITIEKPYLRFPIRLNGELRRIQFTIDGKIVRVEDVRLADAHPDFWAALDVGTFQGKTVTLSAPLPAGSSGLSTVFASDTLTDAKDLYHETYRPQFHFTARAGWINDPNGMVYDQGEYHLSYQHSPLDLLGGGINMHWGMAVSPDMVHWTEGPDIFFPNPQGSIWSGSAVVDQNNTSGMQQGTEKVLAAFYTLEGPFTQILHFSRDQGRTWFPPDGIPVVPDIISSNRDPKVIWYEPAREWVMVLYLTGTNFALLTSPDLKTWKQEQTISITSSDPKFAECPDFFPLTVEGEQTEKWIFTSASAAYLIGAFDGHAFTPESMKSQRLVWGSEFYAAQTFSDVPDGRRIDIGWMSGGNYPGMPFNQQLSFPTTLTLHRFPEGLSILRWPIAEIESLRGDDHPLSEATIQPGENPLSALPGDLYDISAEFEVPASGEFGFTFKGLPVTYSVANHTLTVKGAQAVLQPENGHIRLRLLVDRTSVEVFGNGGRVSFASCIDPAGKGPAFELFTRESPLHLVSLHAYQLHSIWP
jgi:fructan beta-fructosidase